MTVVGRMSTIFKALLLDGQRSTIPALLVVAPIINELKDGQEQPSVESPLGDFFATAWNTYTPIASLPICVNPTNGFNSYWEMPFRGHCRITLENLNHKDAVVFYQINYALTDVPENAAYFHAQFRRNNPLPYKEDYQLLAGHHALSPAPRRHLLGGVLVPNPADRTISTVPRPRAARDHLGGGGNLTWPRTGSDSLGRDFASNARRVP